MNCIFSLKRNCIDTNSFINDKTIKQGTSQKYTVNQNSDFIILDQKYINLFNFDQSNNQFNLQTRFVNHQHFTHIQRFDPPCDGLG